MSPIVSRFTYVIPQPLARMTDNGLQILFGNVTLELCDRDARLWNIVTDQGVLNKDYELVPLARESQANIVQKTRFVLEWAMKRAEIFIAMHHKYHPMNKLRDPEVNESPLTSTSDCGTIPSDSG